MSNETDRDIGYFYDTIHGRVNFADLPREFEPALKLALASTAIDRLTRIAQLGHTSLTYFSATQTRFSHAIGTLLMMNKLCEHIFPGDNLAENLIAELARYKNTLHHWESPKSFVWCHLLLVALYQDCGELPFQKVTSLYMRPSGPEIKNLSPTFSPEVAMTIKGKDVFTLAALKKLVDQLPEYSFSFLAYLVTGCGADGAVPSLRALRQMVDGTIDADRLDYVFRDALLTIGSFSRPDTILHTILRYEADHVVVDDPRPAADFLAMRARLWTFVYASPDVRFRQALLRSFLQSGFRSEKGRNALDSVGLKPELSLSEFLNLDDHSMLDRIRKLQQTPSEFGDIEMYGQNACDVLLRTVTDYRCDIVERPKHFAQPTGEVPQDVFFDLLLDHEEAHKSYKPGSVRVESHVTQALAHPVPLERCTGALAPLFLDGNSRIPLVRDTFLLFTKKNRTSVQEDWLARQLRDNTLFATLNKEDLARELARPHDTWGERTFSKPKLAVSCSFKDRDAIIRIVDELYAQRQQYRVLLESLLWIEGTPQDNSRRLIDEAEAVLMVLSIEYLRSAINADSPIAVEAGAVRERTARDGNFKVVLISLDDRAQLETVEHWQWSMISDRYRHGIAITPDGLRYASTVKLKDVLTSVIGALRRMPA